MLDIDSGIQNVVEGQGVSIALTGTLIVFVALGLVSIFISLLPKILNILAKIFPHKPGTHGIQGEFASEEDNVLVAIGYALHKKITNDPLNKQ